MPAIKKCVVCKKKMKVFNFRPRKTCGKECQAKLASQCGGQWQADMAEKAGLTPVKKPKVLRPRDPTPIEIAQAAPLRGSLRIVDRCIAAEPRRKCPCCLRPVRLVNSVAGTVWLRAHRSVTGMECLGSRHIISYPREKVVDDE
jgi:hypothetical protein